MKNFYNKIFAVVLCVIILAMTIAPAYAINVSYYGTPMRSYDDVLPDVSSVTTNQYDNWLVVRAPSEIPYDADGFVDFDETTEYGYFLYFFSDDYLFDLRTRNVGSDSCPHYEPVLRLNASVISMYRLVSDSFEDGTITDAVLEATAGNSSWQYSYTFNGSMDVADVYFEGAILSSYFNFRDSLKAMFVASSVECVIASTTGWSYLKTPDSSGFHTADDDTTHGATSYDLGSFGWEIQTYTGFNASSGGDSGDDGGDTGGDSGSDTGSDGTGTGDSSEAELTLLGKIWSAITDGFSGVGEKLDQIIEAITGQSVVPDDVQQNADNAQDAGGSILDGIGGLQGDNADNSISFDDFTGAVNDGTGFQDSDDWNGVNGFFDFMQNLWKCLPTAVSSFIVMSVCLFMLLAVLKIFV